MVQLVRESIVLDQIINIFDLGGNHVIVILIIDKDQDKDVINKTDYKSIEIFLLGDVVCVFC